MSVCVYVYVGVCVKNNFLKLICFFHFPKCSGTGLQRPDLHSKPCLMSHLPNTPPVMFKEKGT